MKKLTASKQVQKAIKEGRPPFPREKTQMGGHRRVKKTQTARGASLLIQTDPEFRARMLAKFREAKAAGRCGRQKGVPDGYRAKDWAYIKQEIAPQVDKITDDLWKTYMDEYSDENLAKEALREAVEVMRMPTTKFKLQAAKIILDFTKQKPVAKSEIAVKSAEDFLESILNTDK